MAVCLVVCVLLAVSCVCAVLLRWNEVRYGKKGLPPGTMGWPLFGETTEFLKQGPNFMKAKRARYGSVFKSHVLGCPTVVTMDPEVNRYILHSEGKGFVPGYPQSLLDVLGKYNVAALTGVLHKAMRGTLISLISPSVIKHQLLPTIDEFMRSHISNWNDKIIDLQEKTKEMAFLSSLNQIAGLQNGAFCDAFKAEFFKLVLGTISLPIYLPGSNYHKSVQARERILNMLKNVIEERRASEHAKLDLLNCLLTVDEHFRFKLTADQILDLIISILYSSYETVSTTSMMAVKYLHDHPSVLEELRRENLEIRKRKSPTDAVTWNDYKSMDFTRAVIFETIRLATIVNGVLRKTTHDTRINGYTIPKGWKIYVYLRELNYDPHVYSDPLSFNPWRWQDKSLDIHHNFMMFGGGSRLCPGKELGIVEISTFLHYFVTNYRWEEVGGKINSFPRVQAPNGFHISVSAY